MNIKDKEQEPKIGNLLKEIIGLLVQKENVNWPRDMKIAKRLYTQYPEIEFWRSLVMERSVSMAFFITEHSLKYIEKQWLNYHLEPSNIEKYELAEIKIGQDVAVDKKPKTILEFIK